jgi:hypothetical protein
MLFALALVTVESTPPLAEYAEVAYAVAWVVRGTAIGGEPPLR